MAIRAKKSRVSRLEQGDIIRDVEHIEYLKEKSGIIEISKIIFPLAIVLTQDCDLQQDYKFRFSKRPTTTDDKKLISTLVAPLYNAEHVYQGEHLSKIGYKMEPINKSRSPGKSLRKNEVPRYHYLEFPTNIPIVDSVIDFKHYFSVELPYLKKQKSKQFVCRLSELYREDVSLRFSNYLSRIGLP